MIKKALKLLLVSSVLFANLFFAPACAMAIYSTYIEIDNTRDLELEKLIKNSPDADAKIKEIEKAAKNGDARAQIDLGIIYFNGYGVHSNYPKAIEWFEKASKSGERSAHLYCGIAHFNAITMARDFGPAVKYFKLAAKENDRFAQYYLGLMYYKGIGVTSNLDTALEYFERAAENGVIPAHCLSFALHLRNDRYAKALYWAERAAIQGHAEAQAVAGLLYFYGSEGRRDALRAYIYLEKAALQGNVDALTAMANFSYTGKIFPKNNIKAYIYCSLVLNKKTVWSSSLKSPDELHGIVSRSMTIEQKKKACELISILCNKIISNNGKLYQSSCLGLLKGR